MAVKVHRRAGRGGWWARWQRLGAWGVGNGMNRAAQSRSRDGGLAAVEAAQCASERHLAVLTPVAGGAAVAAADRITAVGHLMVSSQAAEAAV